MADLWELGALELAAVIRNGDAGAGDAVESCINRIASVNGEVNAVTIVYAVEARAAAAALATAFDTFSRLNCRQRPATCWSGRIR